jgi:hypothetical protein
MAEERDPLEALQRQLAEIPPHEPEATFKLAQYQQGLRNLGYLGDLDDEPAVKAWLQAMEEKHVRTPSVPGESFSDWIERRRSAIDGGEPAA